MTDDDRPAFTVRPDETDEQTAHDERTTTVDGRSIELDTGFYRVQVWGDPEDSFDAVVDRLLSVADRAKQDAIELDDRIDDDGRHYR